MAIRPAGTAVATPPAPAAQAPAEQAAQETPKAAAPAKVYSADEARVRGQVRMHALIAGYKVAGQLASTLATTAAEIRGELKKLAHEVADDIEAYSFLETK